MKIDIQYILLNNIGGTCMWWQRTSQQRWYHTSVVATYFSVMMVSHVSGGDVLLNNDSVRHLMLSKARFSSFISKCIQIYNPNSKKKL